MMNFLEIDWADSSLDKVEIEYDLAKLTFFNDTFQKNMTVVCTGLAGISNLCIWDDTAVYNWDLAPVTDRSNPFLQDLYASHDEHFDYGFGNPVRKLTDLLELKMQLSNNIWFYVYCLKVEVFDTEELQ